MKSKKRVKVFKYKTVFKGLGFTIEQAKATFPSGKTSLFERAVRPPAVIILALDNKGKLLLNYEYRQKAKAYEWRLPAGRVEPGELPKHAAQRELQEETGYKAKILKLFYISDIAHSLVWKRYVYIAKGLSYSPRKQDEDEDIKIVPVSLKKAFEMVLAGKIKNDLMAYMILKFYFQRKKFGFE